MTQAPNPERTLRKYYLDWLRVLLVLLVFFSHASMPFNTAAHWHIQNADTSFAVTAFHGFCYQWAMPLFFLVAGASAGLALRHRSPAQYLGERARRLLLPYAWGIALMSPVQDYLEKTHNGSIHETLWEHIPRFFAQARPTLGLDFHLNDFHLWFLRYLFDYSVLALPFFLWCNSPRGLQVVARGAARLNGPALLLALAAPVALVQAVLSARFHSHADWSDFFVWLLFFASGYVLAREDALARTILARRWLWLAIGCVCFAAIGGLHALGHVEQWEEHPAYSTGFIGYEILRSVNTCAWVLLFLALALRFLEWNPPGLMLANEAVLPFYLLHHLAILFVAFHVVQWPAGIVFKCLAIVVGAFVLSMGPYLLLVRPSNVLRYLFGMNPKPHPHAPAH